jgi:hypothetical protein
MTTPCKAIDIRTENAGVMLIPYAPYPSRIALALPSRLRSFL